MAWNAKHPWTSLGTSVDLFECPKLFGLKTFDREGTQDIRVLTKYGISCHSCDKMETWDNKGFSNMRSLNFQTIKIFVLISDVPSWCDVAVSECWTWLLRDQRLPFGARAAAPGSPPPSSLHLRWAQDFTPGADGHQPESLHSESYPFLGHLDWANANRRIWASPRGQSYWQWHQSARGLDRWWSSRLGHGCRIHPSDHDGRHIGTRWWPCTWDARGWQCSRRCWPRGPSASQSSLVRPGIDPPPASCSAATGVSRRACTNPCKSHGDLHAHEEGLNAARSAAWTFIRDMRPIDLQRAKRQTFVQRDEAGAGAGYSGTSSSSWYWTKFIHHVHSDNGLFGPNVKLELLFLAMSCSGCIQSFYKRCKHLTFNRSQSTETGTTPNRHIDENRFISSFSDSPVFDTSDQRLGIRILLPPHSYCSIYFDILASVLTCHMAGRDGALDQGGVCGPQHDPNYERNIEI